MRYFKHIEFDSPDKPRSGLKMKQSTLDLVDETRHIAGIPFIITSGFRTASHNKKVGGVDSSAHTRGYAVDIKCNNSTNRYIIINAALQAGFNRIGIASTFIHLDNDPSKAKNVIWTY